MDEYCDAHLSVFVRRAIGVYMGQWVNSGGLPSRAVNYLGRPRSSSQSTPKTKLVLSVVAVALRVSLANRRGKRKRKTS